MMAVLRTRVLAAVAVLCAATALLPMVDTAIWYGELVLVLLVGTAVNIAVTVVSRAGYGSLAGLLAAALTLNALYAGAASIGGVIPTMASLATLGELMQTGASTIYALPAPLPDVEGLRCLMVAGLALAWWCADSLIGATRSPALAGVPLLAVLLPAAALSDGGVTGWSFALAAAGYLAVMLGSELLRAEEWGQLVSRGPTRPGWGVDGLAVAAAAVAVALFVPTLMPGLDTRLVPEAGDDEAMIAVVNPIIDLHDNLVSQGNAVVLRYETTAETPEPIRIVADDDFDGRMWQPTYGTLDRSDRVQGQIPRAPGLAPEVATTAATTTIRVDALRQSWLPTPYPPTTIDVDGRWLYDETTLNVVGDGVRTSGGMEYTVTHDLVAPTPEQLQSSEPTTEAQQWTDLPLMPPAIAETAREVAGTGSRYEQALNLQTWLRSSGGFTYSENAPPETGSGAIMDFLTRRYGYCVHFASTMAVMARTLGIPARVAVGFQAGRQQPDGSYEVRQRDAHAWPELYFAGVGWVRFEPTPAVQAPALPAWADTGAPEPAAEPTTTTTSAAPSATTSAAPSATPSEQAVGAERVDRLLDGVSWPLVLLVTIGLVVMAAPWLAARTGRRARWRRARSPAETTEAAWAELLDDLDDLGVAVPAAATVREVAARVRGRLDDPQGIAALDRLVTAVETARYAPRPAATGLVLVGRTGRRHRPGDAAPEVGTGVEAGGASGTGGVSGTGSRPEIRGGLGGGHAAGGEGTPGDPRVLTLGVAGRGDTSGSAASRRDVHLVVAAVQATARQPGGPSLAGRVFPRSGLRRVARARDRALGWLGGPADRWPGRRRSRRDRP